MRQVNPTAHVAAAALVLTSATSACLCVGGRALAAEPPGPPPPGVGELAGPDFVAVRGARSFTAEAINLALFNDVRVICAAHPLSPRGPFLDLLRDRLTDGYRHLGFPEADIKAGFDEAGKPWVEVREGPRYAAGDIRIEGNRVVSAEAIKAAIREAETAWESDEGAEKDKPKAHFDAKTLRAVRSGVSQAYARAGHLFPKFETDVVTEDGAGVAHLRVSIEDEGPRCFLGKITVTGCERNTPEEVIRFAGLRPGGEINSDLLGESYMRLMNTGRFRLVLATYKRSEARPGGVELDFKVAEYEKAPPLSVPPTPVELACLRFRKWLLDFFQGKSEEDVVYVINEGAAVTSVLSVRKGIVARTQPIAELGGEDLRVLLDHARIVVLRPSAGRKLTIPNPSERLGMAFGVAPDDPKDEKPSLFFSLETTVSSGSSAKRHAGLGDTTVSSGETWRAYTYLTTTADLGSVDIEANLHPAAFMGMAIRKDTVYSIEGGVLAASKEDRPGRPFLRLDMETGRPLHLDMADRGEGNEPTLRVEVGAFDKERAEFLKAAAACRECYDPDDALGSVVRFAADVLIKQDFLETVLETDLPGGEILATVLKQKAVPVALAAAEAFEKHMSFFGSQEDEEGEAFFLPGSSEPPGVLSPLALMAAPVAWSVAHAFPPRSWPRIVGREVALVSCSKMEHLPRDLRHLSRSKDIGPAGCLGIAYLTSMVDPRYAVAFAEKGLQELSPGGIRKDCRAALQAEFFGKIAEACVAALRTIDTETVKSVAALLPEEEAKALRDMVALLDERKDAGAQDIATEALGVWWDVAFKGRIRARFAPFYEQFGALALSKGDARRAVVACTYAIALAPERASAYVTRGVALAGAGRHVPAILDFDKAIKIDPERAAAYYWRGLSFAASREVAKARRDLTKAAELDAEGGIGRRAKEALDKLARELDDAPAGGEEAPAGEDVKTW